MENSTSKSEILTTITLSHNTKPTRTTERLEANRTMTKPEAAAADAVTRNPEITIVADKLGTTREIVPFLRTSRREQTICPQKTIEQDKRTTHGGDMKTITPTTGSIQIGKQKHTRTTTRTLQHLTATVKADKPGVTKEEPITQCHGKAVVTFRTHTVITMLAPKYRPSQGILVLNMTTTFTNKGTLKTV